MKRWLWIVPILAVLLSLTVFFFWGWIWASAGAIALIMGSLAAVIWEVFHIRKPPAANLKLDEKKSRKNDPDYPTISRRRHADSCRLRHW